MSKLAARHGVISGIRLIVMMTSLFALMGKNGEKKLLVIKLSSVMRKNVGDGFSGVPL